MWSMLAGGRGSIWWVRSGSENTSPQEYTQVMSCPQSLALCRDYVGLEWTPRTPGRTGSAMVRKGSPVRVRQRASADCRGFFSRTLLRLGREVRNGYVPAAFG